MTSGIARRSTGIWELPVGFQLSGLYFFADNGRRRRPPASTCSASAGRAGGCAATARSIARNSFDRTDLHRVDMRLQKRFKLNGRMTLDGIAEVFNMFNHANYNAFVTNEAAANFRQPQVRLEHRVPAADDAVRLQDDVLTRQRQSPVALSAQPGALFIRGGFT